MNILHWWLRCTAFIFAAWLTFTTGTLLAAERTLNGPYRARAHYRRQS